MSYILEALKKSEQEREQAAREQQAGAKAAIAYGQPVPKSRNYGALIVVILLVNVGLVWFVFFNKAQDQQQVAANQILKSASSVAQKPKPKPSPAPVKKKPKPKQVAKIAKPKPRPKKATPKPLRRAVSSVDSSKPVQSIKVDAKPALKSAVNNAQRLMASADTQSEDVAVQPVKKATRLPPEIDPAPVTHKKTVRRVAKPKALVRTKVGIKETVKPAVKPKVKKKTRPKVIYSKVELDASSEPVAASKSAKKIKPRKVSMGPPHFDKMKPEFRRLFPKIDINVHVFDDNPDDRFALIAMKRYVEGDTLSGGITINEITPGGFILTYKKKTFVYPAK